MTSERYDLSRFRDAYLDYLEGDRDNPPALDDLPGELRPAAESFIRSITAARGVDPYASRPSVGHLLARQSSTNNGVGDFAGSLQNHLRLTVDPNTSVTRDAASAAMGLASTSLILARGMRVRIVPEPDSLDLEYAIAGRAQDIARVFSTFPDSHAVLYTTTGEKRLGVIVDRGDVHRAIETPSGESRAPRLRRSIAGAATACEEWLTGIIPEFKPLGADLFEAPVAPESSLDAYLLAIKIVEEVSTSGARARIEAKRDTWRPFGDDEAQHLAAIVQEARLGQLSKDGYLSHLDDLVGVGA